MSSLDPRAFASSFGNSQLVTWEWNPATDELQWTARQTDIYDYSASELNTSAAWFAIVHPDDRMRVRLAMKWALESTPGFREHFRVSTRDGKLSGFLDMDRASGCLINRSACWA